MIHLDHAEAAPAPRCTTPFVGSLVRLKIMLADSDEQGRVRQCPAGTVCTIIDIETRRSGIAYTVRAPNGLVNVLDAEDRDETGAMPWEAPIPLPAPHWAAWKAASGAGGKRNWWICRYKHGNGVTGEAAKNRAGKMRVFASFEAADRAAKALNGDQHFAEF